MYYKFALKDVQKIHFFLQNKFTENIHIWDNFIQENFFDVS